VRKTRAVAPNQQDSKNGLLTQPPFLNTPVTAGHPISECIRENVYTSVAASNDTDVIPESRTKPVPLPTAHVASSLRGRLKRVANSADRLAKKRSVETFLAARKVAELQRALSGMPGCLWTCEMCFQRYEESELDGSYTPCCRVEARFLTMTEVDERIRKRKAARAKRYGRKGSR